MEYLPQDPHILVSSINMLLRDEEYDSLESLCCAFGRDPQEIKQYLKDYGYVYGEAHKQMRPVGYDEYTEEVLAEVKNRQVLCVCYHPVAVVGHIIIKWKE